MTRPTAAQAREFGHSFVTKPDLCIDGWGAGPFLLTVAGKEHRFEDSDRFGPSRVKTNGDVAANPWWPEGHPFWRAHWCWKKQGRRLADDGVTCVWDDIKCERGTVQDRRGRSVVVEIDPYDGRTTRVGEPK
jgi:hypothetical protein